MLLPHLRPGHQASETPLRPRIDHLATLQKFIYKLSSDLTPETRKRLETVIATYQRLYVHG